MRPFHRRPVTARTASSHTATALTTALTAALLATACAGSDASETTSGTGADDAAGAEPAAADGSDACPDTLRFSDTGVEGLETLVLEFEDFRAALEDATGKDVEFFPISSRTAAATALEFDEIDLLLTGPAEYVVLKAEADALPVIGITRPEYWAAFFAFADSGIESLEDLRGETVVTKEVGSTSGHLGPLELLVSAGLEPDVDVDVLPLGPTRIEAFSTGEAVALGTGIKDLAETQEEVGDDREVVVVDEGEPLPNDLFVARAGLGESCADWLQDVLEAEQDVLLDAIIQTGENDKYLESEFVPASDEDYDPTRVAFEAAGFSDYAELPEE
jgi:phosphonate transport system substrate-binding protein